MQLCLQFEYGMWEMWYIQQQAGFIIFVIIVSPFYQHKLMARRTDKPQTKVQQLKF